MQEDSETVTAVMGLNIGFWCKRQKGSCFLEEALPMPRIITHKQESPRRSEEREEMLAGGKNSLDTEERTRIGSHARVAGASSRIALMLSCLDFYVIQAAESY